MKNLSSVLLSFILTFLLLDGCKSAKKSLKRGDFNDSLLRSVDKLKDNPNHSSSIEILRLTLLRWISIWKITHISGQNRGIFANE